MICFLFYYVSVWEHSSSISYIFHSDSPAMLYLFILHINTVQVLPLIERGPWFSGQYTSWCDISGYNIWRGILLFNQAFDQFISTLAGSCSIRKLDSVYKNRWQQLICLAFNVFKTFLIWRKWNSPLYKMHDGKLYHPSILYCNVNRKLYKENLELNQ